MKSYSLVKHSGDLSNPTKSSRQLQNVDLSRPSDKDREANLKNTAAELGMVSRRINQPSFVTSVATNKRPEDEYLRYQAVSITGERKQERII